MEYALQHLLFSFSALQKQMKDILSYFFWIYLSLLRIVGLNEINITASHFWIFEKWSTYN